MLNQIKQTIMTAQIILLSMFLISGFIQANRHGKPKKCKESFWQWLIGFVINLLLLYFGGFFDCFIK